MAVPKGSQVLGEGIIAEKIGDAVGALKDARYWHNRRPLARKERMIAKKVFRDTIPLDDVIVTDGLGANGRPFTMPVPGTSRQYAIHVGPNGFTGMSFRLHDARLLVHELTHVWQGEQSRWSWGFVFRSGWHQATKKDAYAYDTSESALRNANWDDYNPEQQAEIVEHWFRDGMPGESYDEALSFMDDWFTNFKSKHHEEDDPRYRFIVTGIRKQPMPIRVKSVADPPAVPVRISAQEDPAKVPDYYVHELLQKRFAASDVAGYKKRIQDLQLAFRQIEPDRARKYLTRFAERRAGDQTALYFHIHLAGYERQALLTTLQARARG
jgi:hypothetical protein